VFFNEKSELFIRCNLKLDTPDADLDQFSDDTTDSEPAPTGGNYEEETGSEASPTNATSEAPQFGTASDDAGPTSASQPSLLSRYGANHTGQKTKITEGRLVKLQQNLAARKAKQAVIKSAATNVLTKGAAAATGVATGGLSLIVSVGLMGLEFAHNNRWFRYLLLGIAALIFTFVVFFFIMGMVFIASISGDGANFLGGTRLRAEDDFYAPAVAAQASGLILGNTMEALDITTKNIAAELEKNPPPGANIDKARQKLKEITEFQKNIKASAFSPKPEEHAKNLTIYKKHIQELYNLIYPGRQGAQAHVKQLVNSKKILLQTGGTCRPDRDLIGLGVTENTLNVLAALGEHSTITVTCMVTGHRKYVGRPPSNGYPRCGSPSTFGSDASSSLHCLGRAIDLKPDPQIEQYARQHSGDLKIRTVLDEGNHLHIEVKE
jgi:hypothetical protein